MELKRSSAWKRLRKRTTMGKEDTGSISIEDRFFNFIAKDFPDFRVTTEKQLTDVQTQLVGVNGRLHKIEKKNSAPPPPADDSKTKDDKAETIKISVSGLSPVVRRLLYIAVPALAALGTYLVENGGF